MHDDCRALSQVNKRPMNEFVSIIGNICGKEKAPITDGNLGYALRLGISLRLHDGIFEGTTIRVE